MSWNKLVYYPNPLKIHYVVDSAKDYVIVYNKDNYDFEPQRIDKEDFLFIDPGGIICMDSTPIEGSYNGLRFGCNPEHILKILSRWDNKKDVNTDLGPICKVFISEYFVLVMPEDIYYAIGSWLANNKSEGYVKSMELYEAFSDNEHILLPSPSSNIES